MQQWVLLLCSVTFGVVCAYLLIKYRTYSLSVTNRLGRWTGTVLPHADVYKHWLERKGIEVYNSQEQQQEEPEPPAESVRILVIFH